MKRIYLFFLLIVLFIIGFFTINNKYKPAVINDLDTLERYIDANVGSNKLVIAKLHQLWNSEKLTSQIDSARWMHCYFEYCCKNSYEGKKVVSDFHKILSDNLNKDIINKKYPITNLYNALYTYHYMDEEKAVKMFFKEKLNDVPKINLFKASNLMSDTTEEAIVGLLEKEIKLGIYKNEAYSALARLYKANNSANKLLQLYENPEAYNALIKHINVNNMLYKNNKFYTLYRNSVYRIFKQANLLIVLVALFGAFIWLYYFLALDVYEKEKWWDILLLFIMGCFCTELITLYHHFIDFNSIYNNNLPENYFFKKMYFFTFKVGFVEETIKFIPFILFYLFTKKINDTYDFILFMAVPAIAFAFMENVLYFGCFETTHIYFRTIMCSAVHITCSVIVGFVMLLFYIKNGKLSFTNILIAILCGAILHGIYDAIIAGSDGKQTYFIYGCLFIISVMVEYVYKKSIYFNPSKGLGLLKIIRILFFAFGLIQLAEFWYSAYLFQSHNRFWIYFQNS